MYFFFFLQLLESEQKEKTSFKDQLAELSAKLQELQKDYCSESDGFIATNTLSGRPLAAPSSPTSYLRLYET